MKKSANQKFSFMSPEAILGMASRRTTDSKFAEETLPEDLKNFALQAKYAFLDLDRKDTSTLKRREALEKAIPLLENRLLNSTHPNRHNFETRFYYGLLLSNSQNFEKAYRVIEPLAEECPLNHLKEYASAQNKILKNLGILPEYTDEFEIRYKALTQEFTNQNYPRQTLAENFTSTAKEEALRLTKPNAFGFAKASDIYRGDLNNPEKAFELAELAYRLNPSSPVNLHRYGSELILQGEREKGLALMEEGYMRGPTNFYRLLRLVTELTKAQKLTKAYFYARNLKFTSHPNAEKMSLIKRIPICRQAGQSDEKLNELAERAETKYSNDASILNVLGSYYYGKRDLEKASQYFMDAFERGDTNTSNLNKLRHCMKDTGRRDEFKGILNNHLETKINADVLVAAAWFAYYDNNAQLMKEYISELEVIKPNLKFLTKLKAEAQNISEHHNDGDKYTLGSI